MARRARDPNGVLLGLPGAYHRRLRDVRRRPRPDLLFIQYESFPYLPAALERLSVPPGVPYLLDYDDAWFHHYGGHPRRLVRSLLSDKVARLMSDAAAVVVGSDYLATYASRYNASVHLIPTTIDLRRYPSVAPRRESERPFTIGWIGSPATTPFLAEAATAVERFATAHPETVVTLIGAGEPPLRITNLVRRPWVEAEEVAGISSFDVGIMPLPDTPFTRGKCAFKLIQYMGCWKPVIASPVGENVRVVEPGRNGYLASTTEEWVAALEHVYRDVELRGRLGAAGRAVVERRYSLEVAASTLTEILRSCAA